MSSTSFMRLPVELRERIYLLTFHDSIQHGVAYKITKPQDPPLTRVSTLVRREALPLFYQHYPMWISSRVNCDSHGQTWLTVDKWYQQLSRAKLRWVRHLIIRFAFVERYFGEPVAIEFTIRLLKKNNAYTITHSFGAGWFSDAHRKGDPADCEEVLLVLKGQLEANLETTLQSSGIDNLGTADIERLIEFDTSLLP